jgi:hypothetical protein
MNLLAPAALGLAALAIPLIGLYMLRSRRRKVTVASTMLWDRSEQSVSSAVPWQRLPITLPLLLQLLVLALFVTVLARPFTTEQTVLGPHSVFVVDSSGSMGMADRLSSALDQAHGLADRASDVNLMSVVDAGATPRVLVSFSDDPAEVHAALDEIEVGGAVEDLDGAMRAARALETPDRPTTILVFSDGGDPDVGVPSAPIRNARHLLFDATADNVGISSLSVEPGSGTGVRVFVEVQNAGEGAREAEVGIEVDGIPAATAILDLPANGRARDTSTVEAGPGSIITAELRSPDGSALQDGLALDNRATAVVAADESRTVTLLGEGSVFLGVLLDAVASPTPDGEEPDVVVADRVSVPDPDVPIWYIRPELPPAGIELTGLVQNVAVTYQRPGEPILDQADMSGVVVGEAQVVDALRWLPIVSAGDVPLILLGEVEGHRAVYFTFDVTQSNLPVQMAFPIVGSRIVEWLAGESGTSIATQQAGASIILRAVPGQHVKITRPDGDQVTLNPGALSFADTEMPGLYTVDYVLDDGTVEPGALEVRTFAPGEGLGASQALPVVAPADEVEGQGSRIRELAPIILATLLAVFLIEWWFTHQRPRRRSVEPDRVEQRRPVGAGRNR